MEVTTTNLSPQAQADYRLVLSAIDGDQRAYAKLMDRYRNSIYHMMYKMVSNREDADDLTLAPPPFTEIFYLLCIDTPRILLRIYIPPPRHGK